MMDAFNVTLAQGMGYDAADLNFDDPMEAQWRAENYSDVNPQSVSDDVLPRFASTKAYQNLSTGEVQTPGAASSGISKKIHWSLALLPGFVYIAF